VQLNFPGEYECGKIGEIFCESIKHFGEHYPGNDGYSHFKILFDMSKSEAPQQNNRQAAANVVAAESEIFDAEVEVYNREMDIIQIMQELHENNSEKTFEGHPLSTMLTTLQLFTAVCPCTGNFMLESDKTEASKTQPLDHPLDVHSSNIFMLLGKPFSGKSKILSEFILPTLEIFLQWRIDADIQMSRCSTPTEVSDEMNRDGYEDRFPISSISKAEGGRLSRADNMVHDFYTQDHGFRVICIHDEFGVCWKELVRGSNPSKGMVNSIMDGNLFPFTMLVGMQPGFWLDEVNHAPSLSGLFSRVFVTPVETKPQEGEETPSDLQNDLRTFIRYKRPRSPKKPRQKAVTLTNTQYDNVVKEPLLHRIKSARSRGETFPIPIEVILVAVDVLYEFFKGEVYVTAGDTANATMKKVFKLQQCFKKYFEKLDGEKYNWKSVLGERASRMHLMCGRIALGFFLHYTAVEALLQLNDERQLDVVMYIDGLNQGAPHLLDVIALREDLTSIYDNTLLTDDGHSNLRMTGGCANFGTHVIDLMHVPVAMLSGTNPTLWNLGEFNNDIHKARSTHTCAGVVPVLDVELPNNMGLEFNRFLSLFLCAQGEKEKLFAFPDKIGGKKSRGGAYFIFSQASRYVNSTKDLDSKYVTKGNMLAKELFVTLGGALMKFFNKHCDENEEPDSSKLGGTNHCLNRPNPKNMVFLEFMYAKIPCEFDFEEFCEGYKKVFYANEDQYPRSVDFNSVVVASESEDESENDENDDFLSDDDTTDDAAKKALEDAAKKALEDDAAKKAVEDAAKKALEDTAKKALEDAAEKALENNAAKKALEDDAAKKAVEDAAKKALEDTAKKALEDAAEKALENNAAKKALEDDAAKKAQEDAAKNKAQGDKKNKATRRPSDTAEKMKPAAVERVVTRNNNKKHRKK